MNLRPAAAFFCCVLMSGCASGGMNTRPENIPVLEQRVAAQPNDVDALTALGVAYYNATNFEQARTTLARAVAEPAAPDAAHLYLGLTSEELNDWNAARIAYERYIEIAAGGKAKDQVRTRLSFVARQQLKQDARVVLDREQQLSAEPPAPRTIAVMPFHLVGTGEEFAPLQAALSDMIITDLSVSPAITSIERVKINAMIDEMLLAQAGLAEPNTGARVGRLLKAEHVVQGVLAQSGERELRMDATVLNTARGSQAGTFGQNQQVDAIFELEKQIVFNIFNTIGVTLTDAERERINENRTGNLLAFLAYGRGLQELDRGNYQQASTFFRQASQLDPNFQRAQSQQQEAARLQDAAEVTTTEIAQSADVELTGNVVGDNAELMASIKDEVAPSPIVQTQAEGLVKDPGVSSQQNQTGNISTNQGGGGVSQAAKAKITLTIKRPGA